MISSLLKMSDSANRVETLSRVAQWKIENIASYAFMKSEPFKIGNWNWHLSVEKNRQLFIKLYPEVSTQTRDHPPIASFVIRVLCSIGLPKDKIVHTVVTDKQLKKNDDFIWTVDASFTGKFIVEVEFIDLKTTDVNGGELCSIWPEKLSKKQSDEKALTTLGRMLTESILTDVTIYTCDGNITAHRAILSTRSPVFRGMFSHNLKEKELSTINISDMSTKTCQAFLNYIYGIIQDDEFLAHRIALLQAADKYDVSELKEACHDSLIEDIGTENVLERLELATLYQLPKLKSSCMRYLVKFGKIFDIRDDFNDFLQCRDRELIAEIFHEVLNNWKGF